MQAFRLSWLAATQELGLHSRPYLLASDRASTLWTSVGTCAPASAHQCTTQPRVLVWQVSGINAVAAALSHWQQRTTCRMMLIMFLPTGRHTAVASRQPLDCTIPNVHQTDWQTQSPCLVRSDLKHPIESGANCQETF